MFSFLAPFFTGAGIGGEYAAINSAIDELIPARVRGRVDDHQRVLLAGLSGGLGSGAGLPGYGDLPEKCGLAGGVGLGAVLGLGLTLVRRKVPESPRWLFIHGRAEEAEKIVDGIERDLEAETGQELAAVSDSITASAR